MEDIATQLFKLGDRERKGFLVKRDMQRLQSEVSLPPEQLEAVFETLDTARNGYLTLDQFLAGINHLSSEHTAAADSTSENESDLFVQQLLGLNVLHRSGELMCEVRELVGKEDAWHQLLAALFSDLNQLLRQISQLEETLKNRDHQHQEELRRLYEELESQLADERGRIQKKLHQTEDVLREELASKDQQIAELTDQRDKLQERLSVADSQLTFQTCYCQLSHSQEERNIKEDKSEALQIEQYRSRQLQQRRASLEADLQYAEGFRHAQHLAMLQEEGLVKQLRLLQEMQENLKSETKDMKHKPLLSYDDM